VTQAEVKELAEYFAAQYGFKLMDLEPTADGKLEVTFRNEAPPYFGCLIVGLAAERQRIEDELRALCSVMRAKVQEQRGLS
jgi:hypothetical protein